MKLFGLEITTANSLYMQPEDRWNNLLKNCLVGKHYIVYKSGASFLSLDILDLFYSNGWAVFYRVKGSFKNEFYFRSISNQIKTIAPPPKPRG